VPRYQHCQNTKGTKGFVCDELIMSTAVTVSVLKILKVLGISLSVFVVQQICNGGAHELFALV